MPRSAANPWTIALTTDAAKQEEATDDAKMLFYEVLAKEPVDDNPGPNPLPPDQEKPRKLTKWELENLEICKEYKMHGLKMAEEEEWREPHFLRNVTSVGIQKKKLKGKKATKERTDTDGEAEQDTHAAQE